MRRAVRSGSALPGRRDVLLAAVAVVADVAIFSDLLAAPSAGAQPTPKAITLAVAALAFGLLSWLRRFPQGLFVVVCAHATVAALLTNYQPLLPVCVGLATVAARFSARRAWCALLVALAPLAAWVQFNARTDDESTSGSVLALIALAHVVILFVAAGIGRWQWTVTALRESSSREAVALERLRLARELHDIVAHTLTLMMLQTAGARAVMDNDRGRADRALQNAEDMGKQAMGELRALLGVLRGGSSNGRAEPPGGGAAPTLVKEYQDLMDTFRAAGLQVVLRVTGRPPEVDPAIRAAGYRVVQEALTNVTKHGGVGAAVEVGLVFSERSFEIRVDDDGGGGPPQVRWPSSGMGLIGLGERLAHVGGRFEAGSRPGGGFAVSATFPLPHGAVTGRESRLPAQQVAPVPAIAPDAV